MANRIVLVSDDVDFFEYIRTKLELRKSDELFVFNFDKAFENLHHFQTALFILNSENSSDKTLEFLKQLHGTPAIVMAYNDDEVFKRKCYRVGMLDFMSLLTPDADFRARLIPALSVSSILEKNKQFRDVLVENNIISTNNDVYLDYESVLDRELELINSGMKKAVFLAISPNEQNKFLLTSNNIETIILNNIRKNDILMNYAANKYFLLVFDLDLVSAENLWKKISAQFNQKLYAGIVVVTNQKRQQLVSETLNKLHREINKDKNIIPSSIDKLSGDSSQYTNFKQFRNEFIKKIDCVITPVFYQIQQKYSGRLSGVALEQSIGDGFGKFFIIGKGVTSTFSITSPGFSKINIDVIIQRDVSHVESKRITLEPEEFEQGLLEDLLEQFIAEYRKDYQNGDS